MTWNHRVIRHKDTDGEYYYMIHEVHYDNQREITGWTRDGVAVGGDSLTELDETLSRMFKAAQKPVLEEFEGKLVEVE